MQRRFRRRWRVAGYRPTGLVASVHWGENWSYKIGPHQVRFAHGLIDVAGFSVVHGHSSHHPKAIEVYRDRPIFYGCGDFINDYEGIGGYEEFRGDLALMYFPRLDVLSGRLVDLKLVPLNIVRFQLHGAPQRMRSGCPVFWIAKVPGLTLTSR